jgi:hypothetical protein
MEPMTVELKEVVSSNISKIGYDQDSKTLYVKFKSGAIWSYTPVPAEKYKEFSEAKSVGQFFAREIRGKAIYDAAEVLEDMEDTA